MQDSASSTLHRIVASKLDDAETAAKILELGFTFIILEPLGFFIHQCSYCLSSAHLKPLHLLQITLHYLCTGQTYM